MLRPLFLAALAVLALPGGAAAAPAKISPHPSAMSGAGRVTVEAANPNPHALRGTAIVTVRGKAVVKRSIRLPRRSVSTIVLRFDARARTAVREAGGRATITLRLRDAGRRTTTARRKVTLHVADHGKPAPAGENPIPAPAPAPGNGGNGGSNGPAPTRPASDRWVGRMGTEGAHDDFELTVVGGQMQITGVPTVPVSCFENGGAYRTALSFELFDAPGPWTMGSDGSVAKLGVAVNQLVGSSARTITYKVTGTSMGAGRIEGTLGMSFVDSKYNPFDNSITFINCAGAQSFEAVPAH